MNEKFLNEGEYDAGVFFDEKSNSSYRIILLPEVINNVPQHLAEKFATEVGGKLPTRSELAYLFNRAKAAFNAEWYWSGDYCNINPESVWTRHFGTSEEIRSYEYCKLSALAIRRVNI
jgi:hypothetical protein